MKITIATGPIFPVPTVRGGAVQRLWEGLAREFVKRGHEVTIFAREFPAQAKEEKVDRIRYVRSGGYAQSTSIKRDLAQCLVYALKTARHVPPGDVVVTNDFWMPAILPWMNPSAGKVVPCLQRFPKNQCGLYGKCAALVAVSQAVADAVKMQSPSVADKVVVVPNAVDAVFLEETKRIKDEEPETAAAVGDSASPALAGREQTKRRKDDETVGGRRSETGDRRQVAQQSTDTGRRDEEANGPRGQETKRPKDDGTTGRKDEGANGPRGEETKGPQDEEAKSGERVEGVKVERWEGGKVTEVERRPVRILYVGRIHPEKGLGLLAQALKSMEHGAWSREYSEETGDRGRGTGGWECVLVGPVAQGEGGGGEAFAAELKRQVEGVPVRFEAPVFDPERLAKIYDEADVFVYPSVAETGESFGIAPLEAMARGVVPVVSDLAAFREYLNPGLNGVVFDHRSQDAPANLAAALQDLVSNEERRRRLGAEARTTAERFSTKAIADKYLQLFGRLI